MVLIGILLLIVSVYSGQRTFAEILPPSPTASLTPVHVDNGGELAIGASASSDLRDPTSPDRFVIIGGYGDLLSIGAFPAHGQIRAPGMTLFAPDGSVAATTNGDQDRAVLLSAVTLPSSGAYILYVQAADANALGPYTISVGTGWILRDQDGGALTMANPASGVIPRAADRQRWSIRLSAGAQITVSAQPVNSGMDPVIEVLTPLGDRLTVAHDFSAAHTALTLPVTAPTNGIYMIMVSAYANQSVGAYQVLVNAVPPTPTPYVTAQPIDQSLFTRVGTGAQYSYPFQGVPGQTVTIEVHSQPAGTFDPVLELYGPNGLRVAINDDVVPGNGDAALRNLILSDGIGQYTIRVTGYALSAGSFVLLVHSP